MAMPFAMRIATQDWHPQDHVSFASNHPSAKEFEEITVRNPSNDKETQSVRLWPDHCIQDSFGAQLIPEFDATKLDATIRKGQDKRVEMYSAFRDTFRDPVVAQSELSSALQEAGISKVFVTGLAKDYCVYHTAVHAKEDGMAVYLVSDAAMSVDQSPEAEEALLQRYHEQGVKVIGSEQVPDLI